MPRSLRVVEDGEKPVSLCNWFFLGRPPVRLEIDMPIDAAIGALLLAPVGDRVDLCT
jgi:hypothetical protein